MTYDIVCMVLILMAFIGGFQKGVVRIFGFLIAIFLAAGLTIWSAPYFLDFLAVSKSDWSTPIPEILLFLEFSLLVWMLTSLVSMLWKPVTRKKESITQNIGGGLMLACIMVFSIAILSGFFEQTKVITQETKEKSIAYQVLSPIRDTSKKIWSSTSFRNRLVVLK